MKHVSTVLLLALIGCTRAASPTSWVPPATPDPQAILGEAQQDSRAGRHEIALAKFVWFHENALRLEPSLTGVRTSFALSSWLELAEKYPPAMDAMLEAREKAATDVRSGPDPRGSFRDVAAIDRHLGREALTLELFVRLDQDRPDVAHAVYELAQRALITQQSFELAGKYIDPSSAMRQLVERYRESLRLASESDRPEHSGFAERYFAHHASTLVALLVVNGRFEEAEAVAAAAGEEIRSEAFRESLASALRGNVPEPWP